MFYSHEILTSRKHGVATIWLVATLGAKSNTKKLTRKTICDVDVPKACETIIQPEAPMALRLQSNLLYGVTKVYSQQCGYVLLDVQATQASIRALYRSTGDTGLDPKAGKTVPGQLVLADDPAFLPDMTLPDLDLDLLSLDDKYNSQRSSQSMMSIRQQSATTTSQFLPGFNLPSSANSMNEGYYKLARGDPMGRTSISMPLIDQNHAIFDDEVMMYQDDWVFEFDADGNMRDIPPAERNARNTGALYPQSRRGSDSSAGRRVQRDHEEAVAIRAHPIINKNGDYDMTNHGDDDYQALPDAVAFPTTNGAFMSGALQGGDKPSPPEHVEHIYASEIPCSEQPSAISTNAPQKRNRPKSSKVVADRATALMNNDLIRWRDNYVEDMARVTLHRATAKANSQAKKNGVHFVYGSGLNGVGSGLGSLNAPSPLEIFSGEALLATLKYSVTTRSMILKHSKRGRTESEDGGQRKSHKRLRQGENDRELASDGADVTTPGAENGVNPDDRTDGIEVGRDAPSALADYPSSALMPWNVSASLYSRQREHSSIRGSQLPGSNSALNRQRIASASPLLGHGFALPGELQSFSLSYDDDNIMCARQGPEPVSAACAAPRFPGAIGGDVDFDIFNPAADANSQAAGTSQWAHHALDRESGIFFEYIKNCIDDHNADELEIGTLRNKRVFITFSELFNVERSTSLVAAQAFYHVLTLATKGRVRVEQFGVDEMEMGGEIRIVVVD